MQTEHQVKSEAMVVRFWNHANTVVAPPFPTLRYVRSEIEAVMATQ